MCREAFLDSYDCVTDDILARRFHAVASAACSHIGSYDGSYGQHLMAHQCRVALDVENFMLSLGYSVRAAANVSHALRLHDIGETRPYLDPAVQNLTEKATDKQQEEFKHTLHTQRGAAFLRYLIGTDPDLAFHPHLMTLNMVTLYHHERANGKGPEGVMAQKLPRFVQIVTLADAFDRACMPHHPAVDTMRDALALLQNPHSEYAGAFEPELLAKYVAFKEAQLAPRQPARQPERIAIPA